ncbi:MAG: hypothetical protein ACRC46_15270 [Thermoguttaceae bacterium]
MKDDNNTRVILNWLCRSYESTEFWKAEAERFALASIIGPNGEIDSERVRKDFAKFLREIFSSFAPKSLDELAWVDGYNTPQPVHIPAPVFEVSEVNWDYLADYFLLCVHSTSSIVEEINSLRTEFNNKIKCRSDANIKRMEKYYIAMQLFFGEAIVRVNPMSQEDEKEFKKLKSRPVLIEEEKQKGELMEIFLSSITGYSSKYFPRIDEHD